MPMYRARGGIDTSKIEAGFDSLAKVFAPASPQEILAGAKAREIASQQQRIAELYGMAGQDTVDQAKLDRQAGILQLYNPNQSLTAVRMGNDTTLRTNAADNARALEVARIGQQGDTTRAMLAPVGQGATRFVPPSIASAYGVPQTQTGVVELNQGQTAALPDGRTLAGAPKPLSMDEVKAAVFQGMPLTQQRAATFGNTPLQTVMGPSGPTLVTGPEAIGQTPAPDATKAQLANYQTPDGRSGTARFQDGAGWIDTQTGAALPAGSKTFTAALQGGSNETGLNTRTVSDIQGQLLDVANLENVVAQFEDLIKRDPAAIGTTGRVQGFGQDVIATGQEVMGLLSPSLRQMAQDAERGLVPKEMLNTTFNPNIPQAQLLENLLVAQLAKVNDPNGRLSNQQMEETRRALGGGGWFQNAQRTNAALQGIRQQIAAKRQMLGGVSPEAAALRPGNAAAAPAQPAPTAPQSGGQRRLRFNPATGDFE